MNINMIMCNLINIEYFGTDLPRCAGGTMIASSTSSETRRHCQGNKLHFTKIRGKTMLNTMHMN